MIQLHVYPGGKKRIVTMSYDDGHERDIRLIELFNKYGIKATFHLNAGRFNSLSDEQLEEVKSRYRGHEVACHTVSHGWAQRMPLPSLVGEVIEDRRFWERTIGCPIVGMSYPSSAHSVTSDVKSTLHSCGIVYSRTTLSTFKFYLPDDFLAWNPTCHHKDALPLCDQFIANLDSEWTYPLFYIWGHSHELRTEEDWAHIEAILQRLGNNDKIWYATNIDIYNYINAQKQLQISVDERTFCNPTAIDVWVERDKKDIIHIPAGKMITV